VKGDVSDPRASSLKPIADYFGITIEQLKGNQPITHIILPSLLKENFCKIPILNADQIFNNREESEQTFKEYALVGQNCDFDTNAVAIIINDFQSKKLLYQTLSLLIEQAIAIT